MPGMVIEYMDSRTLVATIVDDDRWAQIQGLREYSGAELDSYVDLVSWLCNDDAGVDPPEDAPQKLGNVLDSAHLSRFVIEPTNWELKINGILYLP